MSGTLGGFLRADPFEFFVEGLDGDGALVADGFQGLEERNQVDDAVAGQ